MSNAANLRLANAIANKKGGFRRRQRLWRDRGTPSFYLESWWEKRKSYLLKRKQLSFVLLFFHSESWWKKSKSCLPKRKQLSFVLLFFHLESWWEKRKSYLLKRKQLSFVLLFFHSERKVNYIILARSSSRVRGET